MAQVWIEEIGDYVSDGDPWADFFHFVDECAGLGCVEPICFGPTWNHEHRLIVRDAEGWFYAVGVAVEEGSPGSYWEPACGAEWWVDESAGCACGRCE